MASDSKWHQMKQTSTKPYSEPCQTTKMGFFAELINGFKPLIIFPKICIFDVWLGSEYVSEAFTWFTVRTYWQWRYNLKCIKHRTIKFEP